MKVAGSSVEVALSKHCGDEDVLTGTNHFDEISSDEYDYPTRNNIFKHTLKGEVALSVLSQSGNIHKVTPEMIDSGVLVEVLEPRFHMHAFPEQVFSRYEKNLSDYRKITIVRNPWDMIVSFFWWSFYTSPAGYIDSNGVTHSDNIDLGFSVSSHPEAAPTALDDAESLRRKLEIFCQLAGDFKGPSGREKNQNVLEWFIRDSKKFYKIEYDFVLRQESLQSDYDIMCQDLEISKSTIPRLKSTQRKVKIPYQSYYNDWTRQYVDDRLSMWIERFRYTFD
tara:strand:- start:416 stop:1255 length:840 start_codon:yes stop_codon:yes gene_type:complete